MTQSTADGWCGRRRRWWWWWRLGLNFVVTNMSVSQQPTFTDPSAGSGSDTVVIVLVIVIIALVIGTGAYLLCRKKHDPTDNLKLFKQPDGNETLQQKNKVVSEIML